MTQVLFNPLPYIDRLTRGGLTPDQARAHAEALEAAFSESVATKRDLVDVKNELKGDIADLRAELKSDIAELRAELKGDIGDLRAELKGDIGELNKSIQKESGERKQDTATLRTEIAQSKNETLRWVFGFNVGLVGAVLGIVKFVH
ncbi:coiled-coil domain-containing protein [uncultured Rhodoblastus sp.]|uniref:coiled-coil domain-containing protein n=1 Tax=uncultured Rhodoblastus sp. TaxID=543037 RepID=UPI0025E6C431|nr:coiled-coil domain-containing protein [uncultured Rhodoblastus sp.]